MSEECNERTLAKALRPFGWTCGPEFWQRYYADPWVFCLAIAVERQHAMLTRAEDVLSRHWFTSVDDGEYAESFNNDDVIEVSLAIRALLGVKR